MKVIVTEAAWTDMLAIAQYIQRDSPARAPIFLEELYDRCHQTGAARLHFHSSKATRTAERAGVHSAII
jgi:plasmid stabilization system protein ParE